MNPFEQLDAEFAARDPYARLHEHLAGNDDQFLEDLVAMRKRKGLTQDTVAVRMNRSKTAVSNFERLGADPHLSTIRRYAAAVGACVKTDVRDYDRLGLSFEDGVELFISHAKAARDRVIDECAGVAIDWQPV